MGQRKYGIRWNWPASGWNHGKGERDSVSKKRPASFPAGREGSLGGGKRNCRRIPARCSVAGIGAEPISVGYEPTVAPIYQPANMVLSEGLESSRFGLQGRCSTSELRQHGGRCVDSNSRNL